MKPKRLRLIPLTLGLALALILVLFVSLSLAAPGNPDPSPDPNTHTAPPTTTVALTYDEVISAATVTSRTFAVHAFQTGLLTATHGVASDGNTIVVTPTRPFHPGELVQTTATTFTLSITGEQPLSYTVWGFRAAVGGGSGAFAPHPTSPTFGAGSSYSLALGDVDGDGDLDAIVANASQPEDVYLNAGSGVFVPHPISPTLGAGSSFDVALGDVDGDGDLDAILAKDGPQAVYLNDGAGGFTPHPNTVRIRNDCRE